MKWFHYLVFPLAILAGLVAAGLLVGGLVIALAYPNLPSLQALTEYQPKVPLRVYTAEGEIKLSPLGEVKVNDRPALGVKVARKDFNSDEKKAVSTLPLVVLTNHGTAAAAEVAVAALQADKRASVVEV